MTDLLTHLLSLKDPKEIEEISGHLPLEDLKQLVILIEKSGDEFKDRLTPILKGMQPAHFAVLAHSPIFQNQAHTQALQQKARDLIEHFKKVYDQYSEEKTTLDDCINEFPLFPVNASFLSSICNQIVQLSDKINLVNHLLDSVLKIAWLSENTDLIDAFSNFKNQFMQLSAKENNQPTLLMQRLNSIFGQENGAPSLDGLAALGIQYKEDYKHLAEALDMRSIPEQTLVAAIHDRLNAAGLSTVEDLKKNKIYTKEHLLAFLKKS